MSAVIESFTHGTAMHQQAAAPLAHCTVIVDSFIGEDAIRCICVAVAVRCRHLICRVPSSWLCSTSSQQVRPLQQLLLAGVQHAGCLQRACSWRNCSCFSQCCIRLCAVLSLLTLSLIHGHCCLCPLCKHQ
jgi:hypothetical protein